MRAKSSAALGLRATMKDDAVITPPTMVRIGNMA